MAKIFKICKYLLIIFGSVVILLIIIIAYGYRSATKLPDNNPNAFQALPKIHLGKVVVCVGDSITHGRIGHNYVDELSQRFQSGDYTFVNAGINSEFAYNVLQRLDEIIKCDPDYITILIGSNDVLASMNDHTAIEHMKKLNLPQKPGKQWFEENLTAIVHRLQADTKAKIVLLTLPPISEDRHAKRYRRAREYSEIVIKTADQYKLDYLPLNETINEKLLKSRNRGKSQQVENEGQLMTYAILLHYLLNYSWNEIADKYNFKYLIDNTHLSGRGAMVTADLIENYIRSN